MKTKNEIAADYFVYCADEWYAGWKAYDLGEECPKRASVQFKEGYNNCYAYMSMLEIMAMLEVRS